MSFNREKFKKLVHYITYKAEPAKLGKTKLNKILWLADLFTYLKTGQPITGETYIKRQFGPVSKNILSIMEELESEGNLAIRSEAFHGYEKKSFFALKVPDLSTFSGAEISLVDNLICMICEHYTAAGISEATHDGIWELAEIGEEIPYCSIFASSLAEVDEGDLMWAKEKLGIAV